MEHDQIRCTPGRSRPGCPCPCHQPGCGPSTHGESCAYYYAASCHALDYCQRRYEIKTGQQTDDPNIRPRWFSADVHGYDGRADRVHDTAS